MSIQESFYKKVLFDTPDCVKVLDLAARLISMNENGKVALCIRNFSDVEGTDWRTFWSEPYRERAHRAVEQAACGDVGHFVGRYDVEGRERWWDVTVTSIPGEDRLLAVSRDITAERVSAEAEAQFKARAQTHLRAINDASNLLSSSLDFDVTLSSVADLALDAFATLCVLEIVDGFGHEHSIVRVRRGLESSMLDALRLELKNGAFTKLTRRVRANGSALLEESVSPTVLASIETSPDVTRIVLGLGVSSLMAIPLVHDGIISGVMTLGALAADPSSGSAQFDWHDVRFAEELGRRAGVALANAQSYGRERAIAVRMQESALPDVLPQVDHLALSVAYRPSSLESTIGGDWFDAFVLRDGRVALTLGDVGGHGLTAALIMTKLRQTMRAAALSDPSVVRMLNIADELLQLEGRDAFATAVAAIYDPQTHEMHIAGAGHPGPYLRRSDGRIEDLTGLSPMLGLGIAQRDSRTVSLEPGAIVAFFTDGLVEFDRNLKRGFDRLEHALGALSVDEADHLAELLVSDVVRGRATPDDIAVLIATIRPPGVPKPALSDR